MNYLDRSNLTAAYVSGMKKDLDFHGKQFNIINTCFTIGYIMLVCLLTMEREGTERKKWSNSLESRFALHQTEDILPSHDGRLGRLDNVHSSIQASPRYYGYPIFSGHG